MDSHCALVPLIVCALLIAIPCVPAQVGPVCAGYDGVGLCSTSQCVGFPYFRTNCTKGQTCCLIDWGPCVTTSGNNGTCTVPSACTGASEPGNCTEGTITVGCCAPNASQYINSVIPGLNLPDPGVVFNPVDGLYYATMTTNFNSNPNKFPIFSSPDLATWTHVGYVFPDNDTPSWAVQDFWAPEIHLVNGKYMVYFAARTASGMLSVGVAVSSTISGPYVDALGQPLVYNASVGNIDPTHFVDPNTGLAWLVWKEDGNDPAHYEPETPIWAQAIDVTGTVLSGPKILLLENNRSSWEAGLVEGPWIIKIGAYYYLFYSANVYDTTAYALGVARSTQVLGPYEKNPANPIVQSNSRFAGPGHCSALALGPTGPYVLLYHAWLSTAIGGNFDRLFILDYFTIDSDGWPTVAGDSPSFLPNAIPISLL